MRPSAAISFTFNGTRYNALQGESIAAALAAVDIVALGQRRDGTPRGVWCGMGVCQECLVNVDGRPSLRACMTSLTDGMNVAAQGYLARMPAAKQSDASAPAQAHRTQMLVVGAGPAGLSAARAAALCGASVAIVDERAAPGGQYFKQLAASQTVVDFAGTDAQLRRGHALIAKVEKLGVKIWRDAALWGAFSAHELAVSAKGTQHVFVPERMVLATGAYERGVPIPGWTLPGYMTTGAAQTLLRAYRIAPGRRVLVAGNGPLNLQLAAELVAAGVDVVAVVEAAPRPGPRNVAALLHAAISAPGLIRDGTQYLARMRRARVPVIYSSALIAAHGADRVHACTIARIDSVGRPVANALNRLRRRYGFAWDTAFCRPTKRRARLAAGIRARVRNTYLRRSPMPMGKRRWRMSTPSAT